MNFPETIYSYIQQEENAYQTSDVEIFDNYSWNMPTHIQMSVSFKHGKFLTASNDPKFKPPFRMVVLPILRLRYRAEDIDVKDSVIYVEDPDKFHLSFLVKKYHDDVFVVENDLDTFFDKAKEEKIDLGGCLVKKGDGPVPEWIPLQSIAFCDQTDILGGPIGLKFNFTPDKLRTKAKSGWGDPKNGATISLDELIILAKSEKDPATTADSMKNPLTGKNIEVYIVRGQMPAAYLNEKGKMEDMVNQVQVIAFYNDEKGKVGQTLYRSKETEEVYKFHNPEELYNRALGFGGVEELFDAQIWTNFAEIHKTEMLKAASKVILWTDDDAYANRQKIVNLKNLEITTVSKDSRGIAKVHTGSPNIQLFTQALGEWENHAREIGGATEPLLGKQPPAGTPFRLQERVVFEGKGLHEYRKGKFAKFIEEIYKDWIIPHIKREIVKGKKFLSTLSEDEMLMVSERLAINKANKFVKEKILSGEIVTEEEIEAHKTLIKETFRQGGNKKFIEILKDEFKDAPLAVKVVIAGKQKDLSMMVDKLVNVLRQYMATPQMRQDPVALKLFNKILEASGISPLELGELASYTPPPSQTGQGVGQGAPDLRPMQEMTGKGMT